jgi:hypothetical protein
LSILDGYIHDTLTEALSAACIASDAVLIVQVSVGTAYNPTVSDVSHSCSGWRDSYSAQELVNTSILSTDTKVYLLASSLSVAPLPGNSVTLDGVTYVIITVQLDAASVAYVCQCRA